MQTAQIKNPLNFFLAVPFVYNINRDHERIKDLFEA